MKRTLPFVIGAIAAAACAFVFGQQQAQIPIDRPGGKKVIAVPDFRGGGQAQQFMDAFNRTLWNELQNSGQVKLVPKTFYPIQVPQQPSDFKTAPQIPSLTQWSGPPVNSN